MTDIALQVVQTRTEGMLGASEAAAALGLDKYTSPLTVWKRLRGLPTDEVRSPALDEAAEWGQALEPVVRGKYALLRRRNIAVPLFSLERDGWLRASPDGFVMSMDIESPTTSSLDRRGVELNRPHFSGLYQGKTASAWLRDEWEGGIPAKYEIQVRVEMAVTDLPWCDVCCLLGGQRFIGPVRIERDMALEDRLLTDLRAFWALVQSGREPSPDHTAAWRSHVSEKMRQTKVTMTADDELREIVDYWLEQRRKRKKYAEEEDAAKNDLLLRLAAAGATAIDLGGDRKVTAYKVGGRTDYKGWATELAGKAAVPAKFKAEGKTWGLRAPSDDGDE